ncbi:Nramp family divalent metal transporter [Rhodohalobacter mucosus]|uniref:Permease n=1 Tax=Rhodohalobacter mucosus TaxID=2079485 RepID=A0A316TNJ6_9BACT|nr:Nramp family divalent metal transporter [Rhodohalobacter mucosus]PWN05980.1 permease [Rhodohalobacter mucosus]
MDLSGWHGIRKTLGPGIIMAAAAIGVSHLVQSTRAGAEYGFALVWAVLLANLFKYPFLEFGPRYALATGQNMIRGYAKLGKAALWVFVLFTLLTMFAIHAAVTIVTGSLASNLTGIDLPVIAWSGIVLIVCVLLLIQNRFSFFDSLIKALMVIFALSTIIAVVAAFSITGYQAEPGFIPPDIWTVSGVAFLIALMGWMPIPIDAAAWHSIWTVEKMKLTGYKPKLSEVRFDFNLGYIGAALIALFFLALGALIMYGSGESYASSAAAFSNQFLNLYTLALGDWSGIVIVICAFTTMFSTTLTVTDTYPRVLTHILNVLKPQTETSNNRIYRILLPLISAGSFLFLVLLGDQFRLLIDLATTLSFLTAPVLAYMNHKLIHHPDIPDEFRPKPWLSRLSIFGILFLTLFAFIYIYWTVLI